MRWIVVLSAFAIMLCAESACFGNDKQQGPKIDVAGLTAEDVTQRAFAAVQRPGLVFHAKLTLSMRGYDKVAHEETWVDPDLQVARQELEGSVSHIYTRGCDVLQRGGHTGYGGQLKTQSRNPLLASSLDYLEALEPTEEDLGEREVEAVFVGGVPAVRVRRSGRHTGDFPGDYKIDVVLDRSFLPLRVEINSTQEIFSKIVSAYASDFIPTDALPTDFFSITALPDEDLSNSFPQCKVSE